MRETVDRWVTNTIIALSLTSAALRHAHRSAARRRIRRQHGAY
jgi:hypothetical protein